MTINSDYLDSLSLEELNVILKQHKIQIKRIISAIYKKQRDIYNVSTVNLGELISIEMNILNNLGYTVNTIYKEEAKNISKKFLEDFTWKKRHSRYSNECLATTIVWEILEYYDAKYDLNYLLTIHDVNFKDFYELEKIVSKWLYKYYWKE